MILKLATKAALYRASALMLAVGQKSTRGKKAKNRR
jgi:hypothetical protein